MPALNFSVYCGICGSGCCNETSVDDNRVTVECKTCKEKIENLENDLFDCEQRVLELELELGSEEE